MYIYKRVNGNNTTGHFNLIKPFCDRYKFLDRQTYSGHDMITTPAITRAHGHHNATTAKALRREV